MTNKEQREQWADKFYEYENQRKGCDCSTECLLKSWLTACEYMHENMSQSRYNFWKLTRIQKKKINVLVEALEFYAKPNVWGTDLPGMKTAIDTCDQEEFENEHSTWGIRGGKKARQALQKIKELDASGSEAGACGNESEGK